ncbi:MAG TPA: TetR/AcrR family transcriptional regulator [Pseudonocardia sp.]|jgi:TetR/AcrR family transcriptional repressor of lmrAB and yxaGH operons|nr:TetR/AcrR family transcriptional regulator [Pseudonocardia sp.]
MPERAVTRTRMIEAAARLFQRHGYAATSWRVIVAEAGTPWGSAHHCFPGGKQELAIEALRLSSRRVANLLEQSLAEGTDVADGVIRWFDAAGAHLADSGYVEGCPIATVALETADEPAVAEACAVALRSWTAPLVTALLESGSTAQHAEQLASLIVSGLEGALLTARLQHDRTPLTFAAQAIEPLLRMQGRQAV